MSGSPLVSIVTPVYNLNLDLFAACEQSIHAQRYQNYEWLLIDDNNDEHDWRVLDNIASRDARVHVLGNGHHGVSHARNIGLTHCHGKYITFIDSDDVVSSFYLEHAIREMEKNDADALIGRFKLSGYLDKVNISDDQSGKSKLLSGSDLQDFIRFTIAGFPLKGHSVSSYFNINPSAVAPRFYRSSLLEGIVFPENLTLGEDSFFGSMALCRAKKVIIFNEIIYYYINNNNSATNQKNIENLIDQIGSANEYYNTGVALGWEKTDVEMHIVNMLISRFSRKANSISSSNLYRVVNKFFSLKASEYFSYINMKEYEISFLHKLMRLFVIHKNAILACAILKIASLRR